MKTTTIDRLAIVGRHQATVIDVDAGELFYRVMIVKGIVEDVDEYQVTYRDVGDLENGPELEVSLDFHRTLSTSRVYTEKDFYQDVIGVIEDAVNYTDHLSTYSFSRS